MITEIAMKQSKIARTGAIEVKFMGADVSTIMFTLEKVQDTLEVRSKYLFKIQPFLFYVLFHGLIYVLNLNYSVERIYIKPT